MFDGERYYEVHYEEQKKKRQAVGATGQKEEPQDADDIEIGYRLEM